jgi:transposase
MTQMIEKAKYEFVGIDVAKDKFDVCLSDNKKISCLYTKVGLKKLIKNIPSPEDCIIVLEPTAGYEKKLIDYLQKAQYKVILANGLRVRRYAQAMGFLAKNDPIDSFVIKSFGEDMYPKGNLEVLLQKTDEFKKLELWLNRSRQLTKSMASEKQRIEKSSDNEIIGSMEQVIRYLERELRKSEEKIKFYSEKNNLSDKINKFKKIKGIGDVCANALVVYLPELGKYDNKKIAALVGVAPYCKESGKYKGKNVIQGGRETLRSILYMGILSAIKHNLIIKEFYDRLIKKGKYHNIAMVACIRKMLTILNAMERNNTQWQENYVQVKI